MIISINRPRPWRGEAGCEIRRYLRLASDKRASVKSFLTTAKHAISRGSDAAPRCFLSTTRQKNLDAIGQLGLTLADVQDEILSLSVDDFSEGPLKDKHVPGDLWVFGKMIRGKEVYIKLRLSGDEKRPNVFVVSFPFAESPIQ